MDALTSKIVQDIDAWCSSRASIQPPGQAPMIAILEGGMTVSSYGVRVKDNRR
jgi:hypothetical protein